MRIIENNIVHCFETKKPFINQPMHDKVVYYNMPNKLYWLHSNQKLFIVLSPVATLLLLINKLNSNQSVTYLPGLCHPENRVSAVTEVFNPYFYARETTYYILVPTFPSKVFLLEQGVNQFVWTQQFLCDFPTMMM